MSIFTNRAAKATDEAMAYTTAVLELLGDRDPLAVLRATAGELAAIVGRHDAARLRRPEAPGKWSAAGVIQHLADSDLVWAYRLRMVVGQDRPPLTGYDQDSWAARFQYDAADPAQALQDFELLRRLNLRLLDRLSPADRARVGVHSQRGDESVDHMIRLYAGHDLVHLRQIHRILG